MQKKISIVIGTRPEAIKMAPLILELKKDNNNHVEICCTGQHKTMFDDALLSFGLRADIFLDVMQNNQTLESLTCKLITHTSEYYENAKPDFVLVHGDTTTAMVAALSSFYKKIKIGHVEAGLRTYDLYSPFPEEYNRRSIGLCSKYHYAPTENSKNNLLKESINSKNIIVTGNTVIDALMYTVQKLKKNKSLMNLLGEKFYKMFDFNIFSQEFILITAHRRENINVLKNIFSALKILAEKNKNIEFIYPVHLNPKIQKLVKDNLSDIKNIKLIDPLNYTEFSFLMSFCRFIITDSGGIQEEAPALGKPVLVIRENSERPEAIAAGTAKLITTNRETILIESQKFIDDDALIKKISNLNNPYGDGKASIRIARHLKNKL